MLIFSLLICKERIIIHLPTVTLRPGRATAGHMGAARAGVAWSGAPVPFALLTLVSALHKPGSHCGNESIRYPYHPDTLTHGLMAGVTISATIILASAREPTPCTQTASIPTPTLTATWLMSTRCWGQSCLGLQWARP